MGTPTLTRAQMEAAINAGGSVLVHGATPSDTRLVTRLEDLPPESELAAGDEAREAAAEAALDARIGALAAEKAALRKRREAARAQAPPPPQVSPAHVLPGTEPRPEPPPPAGPEPPAAEPPREEEERMNLFGRKKK